MPWPGSDWERWWTLQRLAVQRWVIWAAWGAAHACLAGVVWVLFLVGAEGRAHLWQYTWSAFWSSGGILWDWSNYWIAGQRVQMNDLQAYEYLRANVYHGRSWSLLFTHFTWAGFLAWCATVGLLWYFFARVKPATVEGETLRGTLIQDAATFTRRAREQAGGETGLGLALANVRIPRALEVAHVMVTGATRSGKTTLLRQVAGQLAGRGASAIIYDPEGELLSEFYDPDRGDLVLNPVDARSPRWAMEEEATSPAEMPMLAAALHTAPRDPSPNDLFWLNSARQVFKDLILRIGADPRRLSDVLTWPAKEILPLVRGTISSTLLNPQAGGQTAGILATLAIPAASLTLLNAEGSPVWSARRWAESRRGWLWLTCTQAHREATLVLTSAWLTLLIHRLLDTELATAAAREVWFVMDEVQTLRRLEALELLLVQGAKRGLRALLGIQTIAQLRERYGHNTATTMITQPATTIMLRNADVETAKWVADRIGQREREVPMESVSAGVLTFRDAMQTRDQRTTDLAVLPSQIADLANLRGYLAAAALGVAAIELTYAPPPTTGRTPAYVPRAVPTPPEGEAGTGGTLW